MAKKQNTLELGFGKEKKKYFMREQTTLGDSMKAVKIAKELQNSEDIPLDELEGMFNFIIYLFDNAFTLEDLYDGLPSMPEGTEILMPVLQSVMGGSDEKK